MNNMPSESNRYDGAPAPRRNAGVSIGDARALAEEQKRRASCDHCDHDNWEDLKMVSSVYTHDCRRSQAPDPDPIYLCSDCQEDHNPEEDYVQRFRDRDDTYVRYDCGIIRGTREPDLETIEDEQQVGWTDDGEPIMETVEIPIPGQDPSPLIATTCECGAEIDEVLY